MQMSGMMPHMMPAMNRPMMPNMPHLPNRAGMQLPTMPRLPFSAPMTQTTPNLPMMGDKLGNAATLLRSNSFTPMQEQALNNTLETLNLPVTKENTALAKSMVQSGVPLTKENMAELKNALLSTTNSPKSSDMQAASFLKSASLPPTSQNITTLSNFITTNPQLGACFFEISKEFRKMSSGKKDRLSQDNMKIMSKTSKMMGELVMDSGKNGRAASAKAFKKMAGQAGIQLPSFMMGKDDEELDQLMLQLRQVFYGESDEKEQYSKLEQLFRQTEDALGAQKLINSGQRECKDNYYYLQLPLVIGSKELTAEMKLYYTTDYQGARVVDPNNFDFDLLVPSENIGESLFHISMRNGIINGTVGMDESVFADFMQKYIPLLQDKLSSAGYQVNEFEVYVNSEERVASMAMETDDFDSMESLDLNY